MADPALTDWPFIPARSPRIVGGEGAWLIADDGRRILDAAGGAIVTNVGHGRVEVPEAIAKAGGRAAPSSCRPGARREREALVERLRRDWLPEGLQSHPPHQRRLGGRGGGGEDRRCSTTRPRARRARTKVMARELSYHGTTIAMAGLSGHASRKRGLEGFLQSFRHRADALAAALSASARTIPDAGA